MFEVGILGSSAIAREHAKAIELSGGVLTSFASSDIRSQNSQEMLRLFPKANFVLLDELLMAGSLQFIVSCLPVGLTSKYFEKLIHSGKSVLFEKPPYISLSVGSDEEFKSFKNHWVGFNKRFIPTVQQLVEKLRKDTPIYAELSISENLAYVREKYPNLSPADYLYFSSSSHLLDLCLYLFGDLDVVLSQEIEDQNSHFGYSGQFRSHRGFPVNFSILSNNPVRIGISCVFSNGERWVLSPIEKLEVFEGYSINQPTPEFPYKRYEPILLDTHVTKSRIVPGIAEQMEEFLTQKRAIGSSLYDYENLRNLISKIKDADD